MTTPEHNTPRYEPPPQKEGEQHFKKAVVIFVLVLIMTPVTLIAGKRALSQKHKWEASLKEIEKEK